MSGLQHAESFRDLIVYKKVRNVAKAIFQLSKSFPKGEMYSLTDQVRRSSRSIGAQIAEAWGKRAYQKHFVSKLTDADSEQLETQHWVETALDCGYLNQEQFESGAMRSAAEPALRNWPHVAFDDAKGKSVLRTD
jgi:four helix bundle protein